MRAVRDLRPARRREGGGGVTELDIRAELIRALRNSHGNIHHDDGRVCCQPDVAFPYEEHCPLALLIERASGIAHHCHCHTTWKP